MKFVNQGSRHRLMSPWVMVGCVAILLLSTVWLFPRGSVFQQLIRNDNGDQADSVRVLLLKSLIDKGIPGFSLRRDYIRQLCLMGKYGLAFQELDLLFSNWAEAGRDSLWMLQVEVASVASMDRKTDTAFAKTYLTHAIDRLLHDGSIPALEWCQSKTNAMGLHRITAGIQMRLAEIDTTPKNWMRRAATSYSHAGDCQNAAKVWMAVYEKTLSQPVQRILFLNALRELQACNRLDEALDLAKMRVGDWEYDSGILQELIAIARAANQPKVAAQFAQILVQPLASAADE